MQQLFNLVIFNQKTFRNRQEKQDEAFLDNTPAVEKIKFLTGL